MSYQELLDSSALALQSYKTSLNSISEFSTLEIGQKAKLAMTHPELMQEIIKDNNELVALFSEPVADMPDIPNSADSPIYQLARANFDFATFLYQEKFDFLSTLPNHEGVKIILDHTELVHKLHDDLFAKTDQLDKFSNDDLSYLVTFVSLSGHPQHVAIEEKYRNGLCYAFINQKGLDFILRFNPAACMLFFARSHSQMDWMPTIKYAVLIYNPLGNLPLNLNEYKTKWLYTLASTPPEQFQAEFGDAMNCALRAGQNANLPHQENVELCAIGAAIMLDQRLDNKQYAYFPTKANRASLLHEVGKITSAVSTYRDLYVRLHKRQEVNSASAAASPDQGAVAVVHATGPGIECERKVELVDSNSSQGPGTIPAGPAAAATLASEPPTMSDDEDDDHGPTLHEDEIGLSQGPLVDVPASSHAAALPSQLATIKVAPTPAPAPAPAILIGFQRHKANASSESLGNPRDAIPGPQASVVQPNTGNEMSTQPTERKDNEAGRNKLAVSKKDKGRCVIL